MNRLLLPKLKDYDLESNYDLVLNAVLQALYMHFPEIFSLDNALFSVAGVLYTLVGGDLKEQDKWPELARKYEQFEWGGDKPYYSALICFHILDPEDYDMYVATLEDKEISGWLQWAIRANVEEINDYELMPTSHLSLQLEVKKERLNAFIIKFLFNNFLIVVRGR